MKWGTFWLLPSPFLLVNWSEIPKAINDGDNSSIRLAHENWLGRPLDFFLYLETSGAEALLAFSTGTTIGAGEWRNNPQVMSQAKNLIISLTSKELNMMKVQVCATFAEFLPYFTTINVPIECRQALYKKLPLLPQLTPHLLPFIPTQWVSQDGSTIAKVIALMGKRKDEDGGITAESQEQLDSCCYHLKFLNQDALSTLLANSDEACANLSANMLQFLLPEQLSLLSPDCLAILPLVTRVDLSPVLPYMVEDVFRLYNGFLHASTIAGMTGRNLFWFANDITGESICELLNIASLDSSALSSINPRCLLGFLRANNLRKVKRQLGSLWAYLPLETLKAIPEIFQLALNQIGEFELLYMTWEVRILFLNTPEFYYYDLTRLGPLSFNVIPSTILHTLFDYAPRSLQEMWGCISYWKLRQIPCHSLSIVRNFDINDFIFMDPKIIKWIFTCPAAIQNFPQIPPDRKEILKYFSRVNLSPEIFRILIDHRPNLAIQLLYTVKKVPDNVLANCGRDQILTSTHHDQGNNTTRLRVLKGLIKVHPNTREILKNMGDNADNPHPCALFNWGFQYLRTWWLRPFMGSKCYEAFIKFDAKDPRFSSVAPEFTLEKAPWNDLILEPDKIIWMENQIAIFLQYPEFCSTLTRGLMDAIPEEAFAFATPKCIYAMRNLIKPSMISLLPMDAFTDFPVQDFTFQLSDLTPTQLKFLSVNVDNVLENHAFSKFTLTDIHALDEGRVKVLVRSPYWSLIKGADEVDRVELLFRDSFRRANLYGREEDSDSSEGFPLKLFQTCNKLVLNGPSPSSKYCLDFITSKFLSLKANSARISREKFIDFLQSNPKFYPLKYSLLESLPEFTTKNIRDEVLVRFSSDSDTMTSPILLIPNNNDLTGFDRGISLDYILKEPDLVANDEMEIMTSGVMDGGGPRRQWLSQLLEDVHIKLTSSLSLDNFKSRKFIWGIQKDMGFIIGLLIGKAFQQKIYPPFTLDPEFLHLALNPREDSISSYYQKVYTPEITDYKQYNLLQKWGKDQFDPKDLTCTRLDRIKFASLLTGPSNIVDPHHRHPAEFTDDTTTFTSIIPNYFLPLNEKILGEFSQFVVLFRAGMAKTIKVQLLKFSPAVTLGRLFNPSLPLAVDSIYKFIQFEGGFGVRVASLIPGESITCQDIFRSFLEALTLKQLCKLLAVWTGTSNLDFQNIKPIVSFQKVSKDPSFVTIFFWKNVSSKANNSSSSEDDESRSGHIVIPEGSEYKKLIQAAAKIQNTNMTGSMESYPDPFDPKVSTAHDGKVIPTRASTCGPTLHVPIIPAGEMLHSLVILLNEPVTEFQD